MKSDSPRATRTGAAKPADFTRVIVDTTVQPKANAFPTDAKLLSRARVHLVRQARRHGVALRQTYERVGKAALSCALTSLQAAEPRGFGEKITSGPIHMQNFAPLPLSGRFSIELPRRRPMPRPEFLRHLVGYLWSRSD